MVAVSSVSNILIELGAVLLLLGICGRLAARVGLPSIPLYLVAGLMLGEGSPVALEASSEFIRIGADLGVVLLLLLLGLEYTPEELSHGIRTNWLAGLIDFGASFTPGFLGGLLLGWGTVASILLGGITYITSSGIVAKLLADLDRLGNRETSTVLSLLVMEDIVMAVFLPVAAVLIVGASLVEAGLSVLLALTVVAGALLVSLRLGARVSALLDSTSPELLLLTVLGTTFLAAGLADKAKVSAAVGAFLIGVMLSGQIAERGRELLSPIRDVFGGLFFIFFGLQIDPGDLPPVVVPGIVLAVVSAGSKVATGWWAARHAGIGPRGRRRAAAAMIPRGEFSIVIAGIGTAAGLESELGPVAACYVLILAIGGSFAMRFVA
jgi:monovalent cation:H+ antiporter-2, CPA2 family